MPKGGVAAYYDRLAPVYGDGVYFHARRAAVLDAIATELAAVRTMLDLGCGNGAYAADFLARIPAVRLSGADLSPAMLEAAHHRLGGRAALVRGDAMALPFRGASFDLVFMSHVLLLVPDIQACVVEVTRVLGPGGLLVATAGTSRWRDMLRQFLGMAERQEIETLFASSGLRATDDDEERAAAACCAAGLEPQWRRAPYVVTWPAIEEWLRIRWLTVFDRERRAQAERWLTRVRPRAGDLTLTLTETLLVARQRRTA